MELYPSDLSDEEWAIASAADPTREARWEATTSRYASGAECASFMCYDLGVPGVGFRESIHPAPRSMAMRAQFRDERVS